MDLIAGAAIIVGLRAAGKPTADVVKGLVERLVYPSADAGGEALKEWFRRRFDRATSVVVGSAEMLSKAELEPQQVPGRILLPIIQNASLEEDDDLRAKWTALLANAASPGPENELLPGYAETLRQLTPIQARLLDHMNRQGYPLGDHTIWPHVEREEMMDRFDLSRADYTLLVSDLDRLRLIDARRLSYEDVWKEPNALYERFRPSPFCLGFLRSVTPPAAEKR